MLDLTSPDVAYIKGLSKEEYHVYWALGSQCTYSCSYCPSEFHDGKYKYQPLDVIQRTLRKLPRANVMFGGGEPTFHPNFEQIVLEKPEHISISVLSNVSRPIAFWERIVDKLDIVIATFHAEFAEPERFLKTVDLIYLQSQRKGKVHLAIPPDHWDTCTSMYYELRRRKIEVALKPILTSIMDLGNPGEPDQQMIDSYTPEQIEWMKDNA